MLRTPLFQFEALCVGTGRKGEREGVRGREGGRRGRRMRRVEGEEGSGGGRGFGMLDRMGRGRVRRWKMRMNGGEKVRKGGEREKVIGMERRGKGCAAIRGMDEGKRDRGKS